MYSFGKLLPLRLSLASLFVVGGSMTCTVVFLLEAFRWLP